MVTTYQSRREARLRRRLGELRAWRNIYEESVPDWSIRYPDGRTTTLKIGSFWGELALPVEFGSSAKIPEAWRGLPVELELWLGGEGLVQISTGFQGGLNPMHHRFPVTSSAAGGEAIQIHAEVVHKGIIGTNLPEPRFELASFVVPNHDVRALERDLTMIADACQVLDRHDVVPSLLDAVDRAFSVLAPSWPTSTEETVTRYVKGYHDGLGSGTNAVPPDWVSEAIDNRRLTQETWSLPDARGDLAPLSDTAQQAVRDARQSLSSSLDRIKQDYPPIGRLCLTGHAHIDLAWLWPLSETRRKIRRTFSTVLDLMDRYPDFTFNQSSAQAYTWIESDDPAVFERIKQRVAEGRWEPIGGMWVESDANITGGEAFVRQLLYGQRYFEATFGKRCSVAWLPDVFGYSGGLPQLMHGAGIDGFFTTKLNWNEANPFPFDLFEWEGIDGTSITAHTFFNPDLGYNGNIVPLDTKGTWERFRGKTRHGESLFAFGWGDGAGGPSEKMLENYARIRDFPALPRLRMGNAQEFFQSLPSTGLPKMVGELYLELHRGTLTTQARIKQLNRESEQRLFEAEVFASIASLDGFDYPGDDLETHWKTLLLNQFHDILPGSSISEVNDDAHRMLGDVVQVATEIRDRALSSNGGSLIAANAGLYPRALTVLVPETLVASLPATGIQVQSVDGGQLVSAPGRVVPPTGSACFGNTDEAPAPEREVIVTGTREDETFVLQNERVRVEIGPDGTIAQIFDREVQRSVLTDRGNQLWAYVDKPYAWDAWDIDESYARDGEEITEVSCLELIETGPIRASVRVMRAWRGSIIMQTYRLWTDSKRVDIETDIDWHERQVLLKTHFPVAVRSDHATFETMYGAVTRPTHRNSPWDAARFEGCGHRFGDLSEPGYGVAVLNNAKYGHEVLGSDVMLSLLRSPLYPDPLADEGKHHFTYSLLPHVGDWTESDVVQEAFALNSPLIVASGTEKTSFVEANGLPLGFGALKRAEDGSRLILRVYEPHGGRGKATLRFGRGLESAQNVSLLEEPVDQLDAISINESNAITLEFRPFEVKSIRLRFE